MGSYRSFCSEATLYKGPGPTSTLADHGFVEKIPGPMDSMDEDRNEFEKGNFQGQSLCREITGSHGGVFKIGTSAFCNSESIGLWKTWSMLWIC